MAKLKFNKGMNVNNVVRRLVRTVIALYVGGTVMIELGNVMNNTSSPFYKGLALIGWTLSDTAGCAGADSCIVSTSGSGILAVVGIVAIAQIILSFVSW